MSNETDLRNNLYPGRGIVAGLTPDCKHFVQIYWIMGRSENSRNRVFIHENGDVRTKAYIESKLTDPTLVIYYPVRTVDNFHIVSNGDQTDTIRDFLISGKTAEEALLTRRYEPDFPNYTPRISNVLYFSGKNSHYILSILKTIGNNTAIEKKEFYTYSSFNPGEGHCIHTYSGDGNPLPSFDICPYIVPICETIDENAERYWNNLNADNRVSLLVKYIDAVTGDSIIKIINRHDG